MLNIRHLLKGQSFWDLAPSTKGSWLWKKLIKLRPIAANFVRNEIHDGNSTFFWHDLWLGDTRFWNFTSGVSNIQLGLHRNCTVAEACVNGGWNLRRTRSPHLQQIIDVVTLAAPPSEATGPDVVLWKKDDQTYLPSFSAHHTWSLIRDHRPNVSWHGIVWFSYEVPRYTFIVWLAVLDRLPTGSRMRAWGHTQNCVFCGDIDESRDHLFFSCPYSFQIWSLLARDVIGNTISPDCNYTMAALKGNRKSKNDNILLRMIFQTAVYYLWRERKSRIHNSSSIPFTKLAENVSSAIRYRLQSRIKTRPDEVHLLLERWDIAWQNRRLI